MDSQLSSFPYWNNLPNEMKFKIIQKADKSSRLALKSCSLNDYQLVALIPFRPIYKMYLWNEESGTWHIDITRTMYGCKTSFLFYTFEEFQNKVEEEIENSDGIDSLKLAQKETSNKLQFTKSGELLKVRKLTFSAVNQDALNVLNQIDPSHLKYLKLYRNDVHPGFFETPQIKQAHHLHFEYIDVTDDQLLNMENPEVFLAYPGNITLAGVNQYIKKCLINLNIKPVSFRFKFYRTIENLQELFQDLEIHSSESSERLYHRGTVIQIESNSSNYQLEIQFGNYYIKGRTICKNQRPLRHHTPRNSFKSVNSAIIEPCRLTIAERNTAPVTYISDSNDDLQMKLTEEMNKINYIKHLKLQKTEINWQLFPPNKQVTVGKLSVLGDSFNSDFLQQIEPIHLKKISINVDWDDEKMYNMPQFLRAQKLNISNCWIQDEDLIHINAIQVFLTAGHHKTLTDSGTNKFIKKILTKLNLHDYNFKIYQSGNQGNASGRLEDLDIFSKERINPMFTRIIVNSPFPEFKLELSDRRERIIGTLNEAFIIGKRITAEDAVKRPQIDVDDDSDSYSDDDSDDDDDENDMYVEFC